MNRLILPADLSREAKRERRSQGIPDPDFVVLGDLVADGARIQDVLVEVDVRHAHRRASRDEPVFYFNLNPTLSYWLYLSDLRDRSVKPHRGGDDIPLELDRETVQAMLVWWDQHGEEALAKIPDAPERDVVEKFLELNGLPVRFCGLNADWSVNAWYLGPPPGMPSRGSNRTEGGLYLLDTEEDLDGVDQYALVRQHLDEDATEPVQALADGSLGEMLVLAPSFL